MYKLFLTTLIAVLYLSTAFNQEYQNVNSEAFSKLIKSGEGILLDVRTPQEFSRGHIKNATLISTTDPQFVSKIQLLQKEKPIYVYCLTGSRSQAVARYLSSNGYTKVYNLGHGIMEWQRFGYPVIQSDNPVASESKTYSLNEFSQIIKKQRFVLVDFYTPWCAPCKKMSPDIDRIKNDYEGKALIEKVDIEVNKTLQDTYNVQAIPGLVLFKDGTEVWRFTGYMDYIGISEILNKYM